MEKIDGVNQPGSDTKKESKITLELAELFSAEFSLSFKSSADVVKGTEVDVDRIADWVDRSSSLTETSPSPVTPSRSPAMTITGKLNPENDTIFLKLQIPDHKDGITQNFCYLYIVCSHREQLMTGDRNEISSLVPNWKEWEPSQFHPHQSSSYLDGDDGGPHHPFYSVSPSQASLSGLITLSGTNGCDWIQDDLLVDDEASSYSSLNSCNYSNLSYNSSDEDDLDLSPRRREPHSIAKTIKSTRFCPQEDIGTSCYKQCNVLLRSQRAYSSNIEEGITKIRSLVDLRSQLLHRFLVEEVNKRRLFKTVGVVENIGFQAPCQLSGKEMRSVGGA
ncbi:hypothetical protein HHK36_016031 [Tetracentron sinense]|uniref:Uncharacterized protein n=1 Tax=Tetracentron sinense TaxID=13715 RepID=A0A834YWG6_TETSI|nr:hypothetical protein HHK36_016031 [Tetracentron sinense]